MPIIQVTLIEGYDEATRTQLASRLTEAVRATIPAPFDGITVAIQELKPSNYMRGGRPRAAGAPQPAGTEVVRAFLSAMEARDLDRAKQFLGDDFSMCFPGGVRLDRLEDLVRWAATRYRSVSKTYEAFEQSVANAGPVIYCYGTLSGEWLDSTRFSDIRFIDRFELNDGKLVSQQVWNDMAEQARQTPSA